MCVQLFSSKSCLEETTSVMFTSQTYERIRIYNVQNIQLSGTQQYVSCAISCSLETTSEDQRESIFLITSFSSPFHF